MSRYSGGTCPAARHSDWLVMDGVDSYKARRKCSNKEGQGQSAGVVWLTKEAILLGVRERRCLRLCAVTHRRV